MHSRLAHGFTWAELLVVMALLAVVLGLAIPPLSDAVARHRLRTAREALLTSLQGARAMAIRRSHTVTVCPSRDGQACVPGDDWSLGWISIDMHQGTLSDRYAPLEERIAAARVAGHGRIVFQPSGTSGGSNQRITLCLRRKASTALTLVVSNAGRARRDAPLPHEASACADAVVQKNR